MITKASTVAFSGKSSTGAKWRIVNDEVIEGSVKDTTYSIHDIVELPLTEVTTTDPTVDDIKQIIKDKVLASTLTADEITAVLSLYKPWVVGEVLARNELRTYDGKLYRVDQAHTAQVGWEPSKVPALFVDTAPAGVVPDWVQPTGAHDAYRKGAQVLYKTKVYESLIDANVWSPEAYPAGWKLIN